MKKSENFNKKLEKYLENYDYEYNQLFLLDKKVKLTAQSNKVEKKLSTFLKNESKTNNYFDIIIDYINNYASKNFIKEILKLNNLKINLNIKQIPITQKTNYIIDNPKNILFLKNDKENKNLIFTLRRIAILQDYSFINYFTDATKEELNIFFKDILKTNNNYKFLYHINFNILENIKINDYLKTMILQEDIKYFKYIKHLDFTLNEYNKILQKNIQYFQYFSDKYPKKATIKLLKKHGFLIQFIKNPNLKMKKAAIYNNPDIIIKLQLDENNIKDLNLIKMAIGLGIKFNNLTKFNLKKVIDEKMALKLLNKSFNYVKYIPNDILFKFYKKDNDNISLI